MDKRVDEAMRLFLSLSKEQQARALEEIKRIANLNCSEIPNNWNQSGKPTS